MSGAQHFRLVNFEKEVLRTIERFDALEDGQFRWVYRPAYRARERFLDEAEQWISLGRQVGFFPPDGPDTAATDPSADYDSFESRIAAAWEGFAPNTVWAVGLVFLATDADWVRVLGSSGSIDTGSESELDRAAWLFVDLPEIQPTGHAWPDEWRWVSDIRARTRAAQMRSVRWQQATRFAGWLGTFVTDPSSKVSTRRETNPEVPILRQKGMIVIRNDAEELDPASWESLKFSDAIGPERARFAPLTSVKGDLDFSNPWEDGRTGADRHGIWIRQQAQRSPELQARALRPRASIGRCRVVALQPNDYLDCVLGLYTNTTNRNLPSGAGRIVRGFEALNPDSDAMLITRSSPYDSTTEVRAPLSHRSVAVVDTDRIWHAIWNRSAEPLFLLLTSWESGPELEEFIAGQGGELPLERVDADDVLLSEVHARAAMQRPPAGEVRRSLLGAQLI